LAYAFIYIWFVFLYEGTLNHKIMTKGKQLLTIEQKKFIRQLKIGTKEVIEQCN